MISGPPTAEPLVSQYERWMTMQNLRDDDVIYTPHSVMVGKKRRVEISCPNDSVREIEELVLYGKALFKPENPAAGKARFQINTIYILEKGQLECRDVWLIACRIIVMSKEHFRQTLDNVLNSSFTFSSESSMPYHSFSSSTFILNAEQEYLHPYKGFDTCIQHGDLPFVQFYVDSGEDLDSGQIVPLSLAAKHDQAMVVALLLEVKAHTEAIDQIGTTPLIYAAIYNAWNAARLLIGADANIHAKNALHQTAVSTAAEYGSFEVLNLLVAAGADLTTHRPPPHRMSARVLYAVGCGALEILQELFSQGRSIEMETVFHDTPLTIAAKYGHIAIVADLIARGADLEANGAGGTALDNAVTYDHKEVVTLLIQADPDAAREFLTHIRPTEDYKIMNFVLSGPEANAIGQQMLMHAIGIGDYESTKRLVEAQMSVKFEDADGVSPLSQARLALEMMTAEEPPFTADEYGQLRKTKFDSKKENYPKIIALLEKYKAPEGEKKTIQKSPSQKNKSVQLAQTSEVFEEMRFAAIKTASTVDAACEAITALTNILSSRKYGYSCAEWLALEDAIDNNPTILANLDILNLFNALEQNEAMNKSLPRQHEVRSQDEKTGEQKIND
jgi:ankyrin repeat protein